MGYAEVTFAAHLQKLIMKKTILALALSTLIIPMQVAAQDLMTQCAKIEDQARRLECFDAVANGSKGSPSSEQKFATVSRAAHTLMGAVDAGLNHMQFGERILAYSSELNVANGQVETANEKAAMERFRAALDCYSDSRTLWGADIQYNSSNTIHMPLLVVLVPDNIVSRHNLPIVSGDLFGFTKGVDAPAAIRLLWAKAAGYIREADELLKAPVASAAPAKQDVVATPPVPDVPGAERALVSLVAYDAPSVTAKQLFTISPGTPFDVITEVGSWRKVRNSEGRLGWIAK